MKKQNFQYLTWLIVLGAAFYAVGAINVLGTFFEIHPGSGYTCSSYDYFSGYGYGYDCTARVNGSSSSVTSTTSTSTSTETEEEQEDETDESTTEEEGTTDDSSAGEEGTTDDSEDNSTDGGDEEMDGAYDFGFENGLTTLPKEEARLYDGLNRSELAKMMSNFIKNVEGVDPVDNPVCDITTYSDYDTFDDEMKMYIKMACDYGVMGWKNDKSGLIEAFRPLDPVTREEFAAVLSRHLFGSEHDGKDMVAHLEALRDAGIMNQIDNPFVVEVRGYVLLMLQRASEEEADENAEDMEDEAMDDTDETMEEGTEDTTDEETTEDETTSETETNTGTQA